MNILDENFPADQRWQLESWNVPVRQIGLEIGRAGMKDEEIIPLLHQSRRATFFTRDLGFFRASLCHARYCLVCLSVERGQSASYVQRVLRQSALNTEGKRLGAVVRASPTGLTIFRLSSTAEDWLPWTVRLEEPSDEYVVQTEMREASWAMTSGMKQ